MYPHIRPHRRAPIPTPAPAPRPVPAPQSLDPDKTATFAADTGDDGSSLAFDSAHTGTNSAIPVQTITVTESQSSTSSTTPSPTQPSVKAAASGKSKLGTGAVVGIAVAVFAILAIAMVTIMTLKHKKKMASRRTRQRSAARAAAEEESKGTAMRMTEKQPRSPGAPVTPSTGSSYTTPKASAALAAVAPPPPAVFRGQISSVADDDSFLSLKSINSLQRVPPSAPQSNNPFLPHSSSQQQQEQTPHAQAPNHAGSLSTSSSNGIPNPFSSPGPSRSPSNATTTSVATHHAPSHSATSIDPTTLASFPAIQYANAHFSISDYTDPDPSSPPADLDSSHYLHPPPTASTTGHLNLAMPRTPIDIIVPPTPPIQASSNKPLVKAAKAREMRGLADLITALDSAPSTAPSSWILPNDEQERGNSRLSRGEGLVTPIDVTDAGVPSGHAHTSPTPTNPLPPSHLFRAALAPDSITDTKGKGKGRAGNVANPFEG